MPDGFLLDVDTSKLREADNYFKSMISNAEKLQTALKGALGDPKAFAAVNVLERVQSYMNEISNTRLSPKTDTKSLEDLVTSMNNVVDTISLVSQQSSEMLNRLKLGASQVNEVFDSKKIDTMAESYYVLKESLAKVQEEYAKLDKEWKDNANKEIKPFERPRRESGRAYAKTSPEFKAAYEEYERNKGIRQKELDEEKAIVAAGIELRRKALQEIEAQLLRQLKTAKMTEDEKLQHSLDAISKESAARQKEINEQRARYKKLLSEQLDIQKKIEQAGKYGDLGEEGQKTIDEYNRQFEIRDKERRKIEEDYAAFIVDLTENAQRKMLDANLKRIKQAQEAQQLAYRTSAQGALEYAGKATTINEMKDAQKYLQIARGNVDVNDKTTIDQLNEAYTRLRATIENLTTAEKNENSLQPTLRNEYARLLVELDKITAAQERMAKSSVYQSAKSKSDVTQMTEKELAVLKDEEALQKRLVDVQAKMNSIEKAALPDLRRRIELEKELADWTQTRVELGRKVGGKDISEARKGGGSQDAKDYLFAEEQVKNLQAQLDAIEQQESAIDDVKRKHDADRARESIALTEKTETQKAEVAKRKAREAYEEYKKTGVLSVDKAERLIGLTDNAKNAAQAEKAIKSLENAKKRLDKTDSRYEITIKDLNKAIAKHKQTIEQTKPVVEAVARVSAADALSNAKNARTLQDLRQALKDLKQSREELDIENDSDTIKDISNAINDVNDKISELEGKQKEVKQNNNDLKASFAGLKRLAIAWIGIEALKNYARKVVETRREFELLQKSLQTLLQDKNEANKIWQQTLDLALVSPFSVKELVGYTRQLAAYRIETELLHDRTKRLADVSAGLGVDMSRLILAYGQVRAASFLRATELRQFTEAGIPMLDELSKKLSEVEGRFVSVGDVMEMISKRKISFEDVDEAFISMTSQGGMFYKMQEKQADTIHGMISNMKDAFDLMFNEIGKGNDSWIKGMLKGITRVVKEWRQFAAEFTGLATGVVLGKLAASAVRVGVAINTWAAGAKSTSLAIKSISATGWGAIIGAVATIAMYFYQTSQEVDEIKHKFSEIDSELQNDLTEAKKKFAELADTIRSVTSSYSEKNKALSELKRLYGDILPDVMLMESNIQKLSRDYKEATGALTEYYNAQAREQKRAALEAKYNEKLPSTIDDMYRYFRKTLGGNIMEVLGADEQTTIAAISSVLQDIKDGSVEADEAYLAIITKLEKYYGKEGAVMEYFEKFKEEEGYSAYRWMNDVNYYAKKLNKMYNAGRAMVSGLPFETEEQEAAYNRQVELTAEYNNQVAVVSQLKTELSELYKMKGDTKATDALQGAVATISDLYKRLGMPLPKNLFDDILNSALDVDTEVRRVGLAVRDSFKAQHQTAKDQNIITQMFENIDKEAEKTKGGQLRQTIEKMMREVASVANLNIFDRLLVDDKQSLEDYRKIVNEEYDRMKEAVDAYDTALKEAGLSIVQQEMVNAIHNKELMEQYKKALPFLLEFKNLLGSDEKKKKSGGKGKDWWLEMVSGLKNLHSEFLTLRKDLDATEARALALKKMKGVFDEILPKLGESGKKIDLGSLNFETEQGMIDAFTYLKSLGGISKEARLAIEKALTDIHGEIRIRTKREDDLDLRNLVEDMFSDYELSLELEKLNIPPDIAKSLFNVDTMSLKELRSQVEALRPQFVGTDMEKEYEEYLKKVSEMEDKAQLERLKKYSKYLVKGMNERVKLKYEEAKQLAEIESLNYTPEQEKIIKDSVRKETQKKMDKLDWEEFKNSSMYIQLFEDLDLVSTKTLNALKRKLSEMKSELKDLDPSDLKVMVQEIDKLEDALVKRNPYKNAIFGINEYIKAVKESKRLETELLEKQESIQNMKGREANLSSELNAEEEKLRLMQQSSNVSLNDLSAQNLKVNSLKIQLDLIRAQLIAQGKSVEEIDKILDKYKEQRKTFTGSWSEIGSDISSAASALPQIAADVENVFGAMDARTKDTIESISEIGSGVGSAIQGFASGNYIQAVTGVFQAIGGIAAIGDKKKERQIQREKEKVEELQRAYEKLEEVISYSYNIDEINSNYEAAKKNLEDQITATEKMRNLEDAKKKTDHAKIKEYNQQIEDYRKQLQELEDERINQLGGIAGGDAIKDAAESFVNAWIDAFRETGDGLSGLEEQFDEVFMNLVKKQVLVRGVDKLLEPLWGDLDEMLKDGVMDDQDFADFTELWHGLSPRLDDYFTKVINALGIADDITKKTGELSGLQEGISGITEDQADILAAYWSSVRFIVSNIEQKFTEYARQMLGTNLSANPILNELKAQTSLLDEINNKLGSVIGFSGGAHIKTNLIS